MAEVEEVEEGRIQAESEKTKEYEEPEKTTVRPSCCENSKELSNPSVQWSQTLAIGEG